MKVASINFFLLPLTRAEFDPKTPVQLLQYQSIKLTGLETMNFFSFFKVFIPKI